MFRTVPLSIIRSLALYTQSNCPKHVELYSKDKFEKLVHLFGFIIRTYFTSLHLLVHYIQVNTCNIFISSFLISLVLKCLRTEKQ